jgi:hypothetical protein
MEHLFCLYPEAFALKLLGFDEPCFKGFCNYVNTKDNTGNIIELLSPKVDIFGEDYLFRNSVDFIDEPSMAINHHPICNKNCSAPLYSQAFKWFRKKYKLYPQIGLHDSEDEQTWRFTISILGYYELAYNQNIRKEPYHKTYEEAELACLKKLIEIVKNK